MFRTHRWAVLMLAAAAAACDGGGSGGGRGGPVEPGPQAIRLEVLSGDAQLGLPGETLPRELVVRAMRADGAPLAGVAVNFVAAPGSGSVSATGLATTVDGVATAWWTLPADLSGTPTVRVEAAGAEPAAFTAGRLPSDQTDLVLSREPGRVSLMVYNAFDQTWADVFRASFSDSLLVRPFAPPHQYNEVFAFSAGRPPRIVRTTWTTVRDTVNLWPGIEPVVPVTIWVVKAPFSELGALSRAQADSAAAVWSKGGIRFDFRIVDATEYPNAAEYQRNDVDACRSGLRERIGWDEGSLNVYYVGGIWDTVYNVGGQAVYCGDELIVMAASNTRSPTLLGHEIGHAFGLGHEKEGNLMDGFGRGRHVTAGQVFWAHFYKLSAINDMMAFYSIENVRDCKLTGTTYKTVRLCPPTWLDMQ
jgi:hypothetical protein